MPFYDFYCKECEILNEDEFFKIADEKIVECSECGKQMEQVILKAPGLRDPGGIGQKWTNDGYQMRDEKSGNLRNVTDKWVKGKNVIRVDAHEDDPGGGYAGAGKMFNKMKKAVDKNIEKGLISGFTDHDGILKKTGIQEKVPSELKGKKVPSPK